MKTIAERLTDARKKREWTQQELANMAKVSQAAIGHLEAGTRKTSRSITLIAEALGVESLWLAEGKGPRSNSGVAYSPGPPTITATHPDDEPRDDSVYIPESRIEFSAGNGRTAQYELVEEQEPATYRLSWFQKYGINPDHVRRFRVSGDSMEPMLFAKDTILVNLDETKIVDNKLYAIRYGDELRVKYLRRLIDGTLVLRSVNPAYDDEKIPPELVNEHIAVIGRVRDRSGTGGL
jgi:phage repressor protein C with HTH and peptisase S24 domain